MKKIYYVVGFMFDPALLRVLLIRKKKPEWQKGLLNGIGGKIKKNESERQAMSREFIEEAGIGIAPREWGHFCTVFNDQFEMYCYYYIGDAIDEAKTMTDEEIHNCLVDVISTDRVIPNLKWLVPLSINFAKGKELGKPFEIKGYVQ